MSKSSASSRRRKRRNNALAGNWWRGVEKKEREEKKRERREKEEPFVITNESRENAQVVFSTSQYHLVAEHGSNLEPKTKTVVAVYFR